MINIINFCSKKYLEILLFFIFVVFFYRSYFYIVDWIIAFNAALTDKADKIFWDFEVYKCAADYFMNNQNPYNVLTECMPSKKPFIYNHPILTIFFYIPFTLINFFWSKIIWGFILLFSLTIYTIYQRKLFKSNINYFFYFIIVLFCLDKTIIYSFFTGNISFILQILLACSFYFLTKKNIGIFFIIIVFVSCFKFYFLIFILCPILLHKFKYIKEIFLAFVIVSFFYLLNYLYDPVLFNNWLLNVYKISVGKNYYDSFGIGSLNYIISFNNFLENYNILKLTHREYIEVVCAFLYLILITSIGYYFLNIKSKNDEKYYRIKIAISILILAACIPRLEVYELIIFVAPIVFLLEKLYNFRKYQNKYKIFLNFLFISIFLLNGNSGVTYPFLIIFIFFTLFIVKNNYKLN